MGVDINGLRFLLRSAATGVNFNSTATLGHQSFHCSKLELRQVFREFNLDCTKPNAKALLDEETKYADGLWSYLGSQQTTSIDHSDYEQADLTHDMNLPILAEWHNRYSIVLDGGTLEHVFNFSCAIKNAMQLVSPGGHFLSITQANNFCGHGFYQFSPELFYSLFTPENGFQMEEMIVFENRKKASWYSVSSPVVLGKRVEIRSRYPVYMIVRAKKIAIVNTLSVFQSDYQKAWISKPKIPSFKNK
jgi:hypothetical protein